MRPAQRAQIASLAAEAWEGLFGPMAVMLGVFLLSMGLVPHQADPTRPFRIAGCVLQLIGVVGIAVKISERSRVLKRRGWFRRLRDAFRKPENVTVQISGVGSVAFAGDVSIKVGAPPTASIEQRVAVIEQNLIAARSHVDNVEKHLQGQIAKLATRIGELKKSHAAELADLKQQSEDLATSEISIDQWSVVVIVVGIIATSVPELFARLLL